MKTKVKVQAVAYLRTSSAANVGGDSGERQLVAIRAYAKAADVEIVDTYTDDAVRGDNAIENRPGFAAMMERLLSNGVRTIVVETANRFARDLIVQEVGYEMLKSRGITLIAADKPDSFVDDGPTATLVRQMLGAVAQFEKSMLVSKLRGARERKRATGVKVEGRRSHAEMHPEVVELVKQLRRKRPKGGQPSYREIAEELLARGHVNANGRIYSGSSIRNMLEG
jgi:DNA invertase Pin-like site-specific DNA recombinase